MKQVAEKANVSLKTVSRVVNNEREIADETRTRVLETINELGYRPNLVARSLVTQRSNIIGLIVPDICNPYFSEVARGVQEITQENNYSLMIASSEDSERGEIELLRVMNSQSVDGVILFGPMWSEAVDAFGAGNRPIITVNTFYDHPRVGCVMADHYNGACAAMDHLFARGHRRIAMLADVVGDPREERRVSAYQDSLVKHGLPVDESLIVRGNPRIPGGRAATKKLLTERPDVTALFCFNDLLALGALKACAEMGVRVPEDCAIVGFDDIDFASITTPALSSVRVDKRELGRSAAMLALRMIERLDTPNRLVEIPAELIVRNSS
ncbi:MAG TPA: LacI family DNA-binding transcriptional regulator [Thermoflexales bacterium]|nr:LacI family DNA-binding transcriptional regulator [Thermoflexales bacterium]HQZ98843.1 LacI family DNA-binding transcriptional regulator [Thermoflexales bacterium]